jgi:peptide deformylase
MLYRQLLSQSRCVGLHIFRFNPCARKHLPQHNVTRRFMNFFSKITQPNSEQEHLKLLMLGNPILRNRSEVVSFDSGIARTFNWLAPLSRDMGSLMQAQYGAGLAAPQIGRNLRMFVMDETDPDDPNAAVQVDPTVVINPQILKLDGGREFDFEGCLSVPLLAALVPRATTVHVSYVDGSGTVVSRELRGWTARIFQHEVGPHIEFDTFPDHAPFQVDHLDGIMFLDRVVSPQHIVMESELVRADSTLDVASMLAAPATPFEQFVTRPKDAKKTSRRRV